VNIGEDIPYVKQIDLCKPNLLRQLKVDQYPDS